MIDTSNQPSLNWDFWCCLCYSAIIHSLQHKLGLNWFFTVTSDYVVLIEWVNASTGTCRAVEPHLHSMAWSMDLKDLGRPFRKFCMLWSASIALPTQAGENSSPRQHENCFLAVVPSYPPPHLSPPSPPWWAEACCSLCALQLPHQHRDQSRWLGEETRRSRLESHWLHH